MKRKINRSEMHKTVIDLIDLGFTVPGVTHMVGRTAPVVYHHLKQAGRMKGKTIIRKPPGDIDAGALAAMRKVFHDPECAVLPMIALARAGQTASVIQPTSGKSDKKAA